MPSPLALAAAPGYRAGLAGPVAGPPRGRSPAPPAAAARARPVCAAPPALL